jgi:hypothetical protein
MPLYRFRVNESRLLQMEYLVEANDENEAYAKAEIGDTVEEDQVRTIGVIDRAVLYPVTPRVP